MKRFATPLCLIVLTSAFAGCDKGSGGGAAATPAGTPAAGPNFGIVDIDRVGKTMGWSDEMQKNLQATDAEVKHQIEGRLKMVQATIDQKKKDIVTEAKLTTDQIAKLDSAKDRNDLDKLGLTPKQVDDLVQLSNAVQGEKNQVAQAYQQFMQQRLAAVRNAYREAVAPVVRRVAQANDRMAVLTPSDALLYYDPSADLTDKVIDDLQKSPPLKVNLPEIPHAATMPASPATQP